MKFFTLIHFCFYFFVVVNLPACVSAPKAPEVVKINFVSTKKATVQNTIISGNYSREIDEPGYKVIFASNQEIAPKASFPIANNFVSLEYYNCDSDLRYEPGHVFSARDYVIIDSSIAEVIDSKPDGSFIYQAQLLDNYDKNIQNICAKIYVFDGNNNRKVWQTAFTSNEIRLQFD